MMKKQQPIKMFTIIVAVLLILLLLPACTEVKAPDNAPDNMLPDNTTPIDDSNQEELVQDAAKIALYFTSNNSAPDEPQNKWYENKIRDNWPENRILQTGQHSEWLLEMLEEPLVKSLIIFQPPWGVNMDNSVLREVKERYPDILIIGYFPRMGCFLTENSQNIFDIVVMPDYFTMAENVPLQAQKLGAKTFIYYYYQDEYNDSYLLTETKLRVKKTCGLLGLKFIEKEINNPYSINYYTAYSLLREDAQRRVV